MILACITYAIAKVLVAPVDKSWDCQEANPGHKWPNGRCVKKRIICVEFAV